MIFPTQTSLYLDSRDYTIRDRMQFFYEEAVTINQSNWAEQDLDLRFYIGDQSIYDTLYGNIPINRRRGFVFNRSRRIIDVTSGFERRNRKSIVAMPAENADQQTADQYTKLLLWSCKQEGVLETFSDAFQSALITGMNLLQVWVDYRADPLSGQIKVDSTPSAYYLMDPYWKKADLSDCNTIWKRSFLTKATAISLLPDHREEIESMATYDSGSGRDGKFQYTSESYDYSMKRLLTYDEYYYRDYRKQRILVDAQTGEVTEWRGKDEAMLQKFLRKYKQVTVQEAIVPTVNLAIVVQGKTIWHGPNPVGTDKYPFVPVYAYYHPEVPYLPFRVQGMMRGLRDAQFLYNRRKVIELDILESQINSGWKYKENALVNPTDVYEQIGQGKGIAVKETAQLSDVEQIIAPQIPPSMIELSTMLGKELLEISGVNEEVLGSAVDDKAGILAKLRAGAGLTTLQGLFDQADRSKKLLGELILDIIQNNYTPGKVKQILEGEEPEPQFYSKAFGKYNVSVVEGYDTETQRQLQLAQMVSLREIGVPIPDEELLEAASFQNKQKMMERMKQSKQQADQMQQQQMQMQMEEAQSRIDLAKARQAADIGLAQERESRVEDNISLAQERMHKANQEDTQAVLNNIKAIKELESIDLVHLEKMIAMINSLKLQQQEQIPEPEKEIKEPAMAEQSLQSPGGLEVRGDQTLQPEMGMQ